MQSNNDWPMREVDFAPARWRWSGPACGTLGSAASGGRPSVTAWAGERWTWRMHVCVLKIEP